LAGIGQRQAPGTARKKRLSKHFFDLTCLCAYRGLKDVQLFARAAFHAAAVKADFHRGVATEFEVFVWRGTIGS
jgi:hypothetical protein